MKDKGKYLIIILLISLLISTSLITFKSMELFNSSRQTIIETQLKRNKLEGIFVDENGVEITSSNKIGSPAKINYPSFHELIGYNSLIYGENRLRQVYRKYLFQDEQVKIHTTLSVPLQEYIYSSILKFNGSVIVMDNDTGAILALVSKGPVPLKINHSNIETSIKKYMDETANIEGSQLLRGVQTIDYLGSTAKVIVAIAALENLNKDSLIYEDTGSFNIPGCTISNYQNKAYGKINMNEAFKYSSNTYFAYLSSEVGWQKIQKTAQKLLFNQEIDLGFTKLYSMYSFKTYDPSELITNAIGQGGCKASALHLCMLYQMIMNNGKMIKPYLVNNIEINNHHILNHSKDTLTKYGKKSTYKILKEALEICANSYGLKSKDGKVYSKTGTAESQNNNHTYIACSTEQFTFVISKENTKNTSTELIPLAQRIIHYLELLY